MTLNEFKAWLEGFEEAFTGAYDQGHPNKEQWAKIKARIASIEDQQTIPMMPVMPSPWPGNRSGDYIAFGPHVTCGDPPGSCSTSSAAPSATLAKEITK